MARDILWPNIYFLHQIIFIGIALSAGHVVTVDGMNVNVSSLKRVTVQVDGRVVTVVGMYINILLLKRVTVQVPGRVDAVVGMNVNVSSVGCI